MDDIIYYPTIKDVHFVGDESTYELHIDEGINYGLGFFETMHITDHCVLASYHVERLNNSLRTFKIPVAIKEDLINELIDSYSLKNVALRLSVSEKNILAVVRPIAYTADFYKQGVSLAFSPIIRSSHAFLANHKSLNYAEMLLSLRQAKDKGYDDCLFFNEKGYVVETAIANLFVVKDGDLITPPLQAGCLAGTLRRYILSKYSVIERNLTVDDLVDADGVFVTNALMGVCHVSKITFDHQAIRQNRFIQMEEFVPENQSYSQHAVILQLQEDYQKSIERDQL